MSVSRQSLIFAYLVLHPRSNVGPGSKLEGVKDAEVTVFEGKCPAGNVGVQVNHLDPVNKGEVVWTIGDPTVVLFIGRLFNTGR